MLSGDNQETAKQIAAELPIDEVHGQMLPTDKAQFVKNEQANDEYIRKTITEMQTMLRSTSEYFHAKRAEEILDEISNLGKHN